MRLWIARIFLLSAFSLLMAHNLVAHVHLGEQVVAHHHDDANGEDQGHKHLVVFGQLDHSFFRSTDDLSVVTHFDAAVINTVVVFPSYEHIIWPSQTFELLPPDSPPIAVFLGAAGLRGPPIC